MTALNSFYSPFFRRKSFLSYASGSFYTQESYLRDLGFGKDLDLTGKTVLELGAGAGRLTLSLARLGVLQKARRYIVVEPSEGIEQIKAELTAPNVEYVKAAFDELGSHVEARLIDYFIAAGVIPHLGTSLDDILGQIENFVAPEGRLHVVASYQGFDRRITRAWKRWCTRHPGLAPACAFATTALQYTAPLFGQAARGWYIRNFVWAFQGSFSQNYAHHLEIYCVEPYSVFWGYADYRAALSRHGLTLADVYPYSLALRAERRTSAHGIGFTIAPDAAIAILGDDWLARWFAGRFRHEKKTLVPRPSDARGYDVVILAYDYSMGRPYGEVARELADMGFVVGRSLFLYQMLV